MPSNIELFQRGLRGLPGITRPHDEPTDLDVKRERINQIRRDLSSTALSLAERFYGKELPKGRIELPAIAIDSYTDSIYGEVSLVVLMAIGDRSGQLSRTDAFLIQSSKEAERNDFIDSYIGLDQNGNELAGKLVFQSQLHSYHPPTWVDKDGVHLPAQLTEAELLIAELEHLEEVQQLVDQAANNLTNIIELTTPAMKELLGKNPRDVLRLWFDEEGLTQVEVGKKLNIGHNKIANWILRLQFTKKTKSSH